MGFSKQNQLFVSASRWAAGMLGGLFLAAGMAGADPLQNAPDSGADRLAQVGKKILNAGSYCGVLTRTAAQGFAFEPLDPNNKLAPVTMDKLNDVVAPIAETESGRRALDLAVAGGHVGCLRPGQILSSVNYGYETRLNHEMDVMVTTLARPGIDLSSLAAAYTHELQHRAHKADGVVDIRDFAPEDAIAMLLYIEADAEAEALMFAVEKASQGEPQHLASRKSMPIYKDMVVAIEARLKDRPYTPDQYDELKQSIFDSYYDRPQRVVGARLRVVNLQAMEGEWRGQREIDFDDLNEKFGYNNDLRDEKYLAGLDGVKTRIAAEREEKAKTMLAREMVAAPRARDNYREVGYNGAIVNRPVISPEPF